MGDVLFLVLRRLRTPLVLLIVVYAVSVAGLSLAPGVDAQGNPHRLGIFLAFYVISYTATTIGFGEIPYEFTGAQRMWVTLSIYLSVFAWAYTLASIVAMAQDAALRALIERGRAVRRVRALAEPFYLVCGYGESGRAVSRALDALGARLVLVEIDPDRAARIPLEDLANPAVVIAADARLPAVLRQAGVAHPQCQAVVALTADDETNQAIAIGARTLRPDVPAIARVKSEFAAENLTAFGGVHVIDPYRTFATNITLDFGSPRVLQLEEWLTGVPGTQRPQALRLPHGHWVLCGYGRFGRAVAAALDQAGQTWRAIDPRQEPDAQGLLAGANTGAGLREAGIEQAVGMVAGTDDDTTNLALVRLARRLNPALFVVMRQNRSSNRSLFDVAAASMRFVQSEIMTHECLQLLVTPLLARFIAAVRAEGTPLASRAQAELEATFGDRVPSLWTFVCDPRLPGLSHALNGVVPPLQLSDLLVDPRDPAQPLNVVPLLLMSGSDATCLPAPATALKAYDRILFAGGDGAQQAQRDFALDPSPIEFIRTGSEPPRSWLFRRFAAVRRS
ncbi:MAG TPA: NAD-binding protein [Burkholderiaceae bacterium]|nr:NAD-binding protein [Burkholderiaceae bacterium]